MTFARPKLFVTTGGPWLQKLEKSSRTLFYEPLQQSTLQPLLRPLLSKNKTNQPCEKAQQAIKQPPFNLTWNAGLVQVPAVTPASVTWTIQDEPEGTAPLRRLTVFPETETVPVHPAEEPAMRLVALSLETKKNKKNKHKEDVQKNLETLTPAGNVSENVKKDWAELAPMSMVMVATAVAPPIAKNAGMALLAVMGLNAAAMLIEIPVPKSEL
jgi:hypothetical protein